MATIGTHGIYKFSALSKSGQSGRFLQIVLWDRFHKLNFFILLFSYHTICINLSRNNLNWSWSVFVCIVQWINEARLGNKLENLWMNQHLLANYITVFIIVVFEPSFLSLFSCKFMLIPGQIYHDLPVPYLKKLLYLSVDLQFII